MWRNEAALAAWRGAARTDKRSAPRTYNDVAIMNVALLSAVFWLALRAAQGLLVSVLGVFKMELPVAHATCKALSISTMCK
jgi:hypothetical protein